MDRRLQNADRDEHGRLLNQVLNAVETSKADGLCTQVITFMCENYSDYENPGLNVVNSSMPVHLRSVDERLIAMIDPKCLPGELEIIATSKVLRKQIVHVLGENDQHIKPYGDDSNNKVFVRFTNIGNDVGHYDCVLENRIKVS